MAIVSGRESGKVGVASKHVISEFSLGRIALVETRSLSTLTHVLSPISTCRFAHDHSHRPVLAPAALAALPSTPAIPDRMCSMSLASPRLRSLAAHRTRLRLDFPRYFLFDQSKDQL